MASSDMDGLLERAQLLQDQLASVRDQLTVSEFTGTAAGGAVVVTLTAAGEFRDIRIDDEVLAGGREEVEAAVLLALRDASAQLREQTAERLAGVQNVFRSMGIS